MPIIVYFFQNEWVIGIAVAESFDLGGIERDPGGAAAILGQDARRHFGIKQKDQAAIRQFGVTARAFYLFTLTFDLLTIADQERRPSFLPHPELPAGFRSIQTERLEICR